MFIKSLLNESALLQPYKVVNVTPVYRCVNYIMGELGFSLASPACVLNGPLVSSHRRRLRCTICDNNMIKEVHQQQNIIALEFAQRCYIFLEANSFQCINTSPS